MQTCMGLSFSRGALGRGPMGRASGGRNELRPSREWRSGRRGQRRAGKGKWKRLRDGYPGWLTVEFEGAEEVIPALEAGLAYLRRLTA